MGAALAAGALLDNIMARIIRAFRIDNKGVKGLFDGANAPFGGFSARIDACFAMSLISETEYDEAHLIRKVRNEFAHKLKTSFHHARVRGLCAALRLSIPVAAKEEDPARVQFSSASVALILNLTNRAHYAVRRRLEFKEWPR